MPVKWKIYYACTMYLFLWALGMVLYLLYLQLNELNGQAFPGFMIACIVLAAWAYKSVLSLTAIKHYKSAITYTDKQKKGFMVGYYLNCMLCVGTMALCAFVVIPNDFMSRGDLVPGPSSVEQLVDFLLFAALACATYLAAIDLALLKTIRQKQLDSLLNFELNDKENT